MKDPLARSAWRRFRLFLLGQVLGWTFATLVALLMCRLSFSGFCYLWGVVVAGPLSGIGSIFPLCGIPTVFWWATALLILAHPIHPNHWTGALTLFGVVCWYFQGFASAMVLCFA